MVILILDFNSSTFKVSAIFEFDNFHVGNSVSKYLLESRNNFNLKKRMQNATLKVHECAQENKIKDVQGGCTRTF